MDLLHYFQKKNTKMNFRKIFRHGKKLKNTATSNLEKEIIP